MEQSSNPTISSGFKGTEWTAPSEPKSSTFAGTSGTSGTFSTAEIGSNMSLSSQDPNIMPPSNFPSDSTASLGPADTLAPPPQSSFLGTGDKATYPPISSDFGVGAVDPIDPVAHAEQRAASGLTPEDYTKKQEGDFKAYAKDTGHKIADAARGAAHSIKEAAVSAATYVKEAGHSMVDGTKDAAHNLNAGIHGHNIEHLAMEGDDESKLTDEERLHRRVAAEAAATAATTHPTI